MISAKAQKTAVRYLGDAATRYEAKRAGTSKWDAEDRMVREFTADLPSGSAVLDIPCGTGRFFPLYRERGFQATGIDVSPDMVRQAEKRAGKGVTAAVGSVFGIEHPDDSFDAVLSIRFLNLIEAEDVSRALAEMQRVSRNRVIFTLRVRQKNPSGHYHSPHSIDLVRAALLPGWWLWRNEPAHQTDYRVVGICAGST